MASHPGEIWFPSGRQQLYGRAWTNADNAPTIVLLCGVGFHTFEYEPLAPSLVRGGFNCLSFDYRCHGRSGGLRGFWTLRELVMDARHAIGIASRRFRGPIGVFGNSLGGMVGILAGIDDHRIGSVVASNCPARIGDFLLTRFRSVLFGVAKATAMLVPLRVSVNRFYTYRQLIEDPKWITKIEDDGLVTDARRLSVGAYGSLLEDWDGPTAVAKLNRPLLILQGSRDGLQPQSQSERLFQAAREPKEYRLIDTGHLPNLEKPEVLGSLLVDWFGRTLRPPGPVKSGVLAVGCRLHHRRSLARI
jgi:alpha-beta hydrolase superfamily lysophospholipase